MERLSDNALDILNDLHTERLEYESEYVPLADALNKLSCYEDITHDADGNEIVPLERLRELVEAEKDGRLVVLSRYSDLTAAGQSLVLEKVRNE